MASIGPLGNRSSTLISRALNSVQKLGPAQGAVPQQAQRKSTAKKEPFDEAGEVTAIFRQDGLDEAEQSLLSFKVFLKVALAKELHIEQSGGPEFLSMVDQVYSEMRADEALKAMMTEGGRQYASQFRTK